MGEGWTPAGAARSISTEASTAPCPGNDPPAALRTLRAVVVALLLALTGCARGSKPAVSPSPSVPAGPPATPAASCSASVLSPDLPKQDLPEAVSSMRDRIAKAATACDVDGLERLALAGDSSFSFSFGGQEGGPGDHWRKLEAEGRAPLAFLVKVLGVRFGTVEIPPPETTPAAAASPAPAGSPTAYAWPSAATRDVPTGSDWAELERVYPKDQVARMKQDSAKFGIGYLGWRAGITAAGDWIYFVEGD